MIKREKVDNLYDSPYFSERKNLYFIFVNYKTKLKFDKYADKYVRKENNKINKKYKTFGYFLTYLYIAYYKKIQKKRFLIFDNKTNEEIYEDIIIFDNINK